MAAPTHRPPLSLDARDRMGVYKRLADVPEKYRLGNRAAAYAETDTWADYIAFKTADCDTQSTRARYEKAGRYFTAYMAEVGRHHALADPDHIDGFLRALRDGDIGRHRHQRTLQTVYFEYFQPIEAFYTWLQWHTDHPHVYHPVLMAVVSGGYPEDVWDRKLAQNDKR